VARRRAGSLNRAHEMQGHIHKRIRTTKDGRKTTHWYVVVDVGRDSAGRRRQKWHGGFRTRREAEAAQAEIVRDLHLGSYVAPSAMTLTDWVEGTWLAAVRTQLKPSTWDSYKRNLALHVLPPIGHHALREISAPMLNALYAELLEDGKLNASGGLAPKTIRYIHTTIHKALSDAVDADLLARNPADRAKPPKPDRSVRREMKCWDAAELAQFLEHVHETRLGAAWHLAAMTGMRRGEILGLRWHDIDFVEARLAVRRALVSVAYEITESTPKSHQARVIDLDRDTLTRLQAHRDEQEVEQGNWGAGYEVSDLVFCRENGTPIHPDSFSQRFEFEVRRSGLPKIRLHDLRHSHATIALRAGVQIKVVSERLGHESPAFTLKQYTHVMPGMQAEAAALFAALVLRDSPA
jgi:integrase